MAHDYDAEYDDDKEKPGKDSDEDMLTEAKDRWKQANDYWSDHMELAEEDIRFARLGEQWPDEIRRERERDQRPVLTINRLPTFIRQVVNDSRLNKPAISVHPVDNDADTETAEIMSGLIRNVEYTSDAEVAYDHAIDCSATCGWGFFRIDLDYASDDTFDMDVSIRRISNPLTVLPDHTSTSADSSDWSYGFVTEIMDKSEFQETWPNAECTSWEGDYDSDWVGDDWVRVAEYWKREKKPAKILRLSDGTVMYEDEYIENADVFLATGVTIVQQRETNRTYITQRIVTDAEILETKSWPGKYIPIVPVYGEEVVENGQRHFLSLTRQAKDAQRNLNYWRSAATELVALAPKAPFIGPTGAFVTDADRWETANTEAHPFLQYDGDMPPQRQPFAGIPAGAIQEAANAADDLKSIMGIYDAGLGNRSNEIAGVAINARQKESDVSTFHYIDNLARGIRHAGRILIDLIPRVYTTPRVLRVMGMDGKPQSVKVNQPYESQSGLQKIHDLTTGKYDLTVKTGPSFSSQRESAHEQMTALVQANPQLGQIIGDLIAEAADWPGSEEVAKRLKALLPKPIQDLQKLDDLPPDAQIKVGQAQAQVEQMSQMLEQGKVMLTQLQQENAELKVTNKNKQSELQVKMLDIEKSFEADMAKIQADLQIAAAKEAEAGRRLVIEEAIDALKQRVEGVSMVTKQPYDDMAGMMQMMNESGQALSGVSTALTQAAERLAGTQSRTKTVRIQAPSGAEYTGTVVEE